MVVETTTVPTNPGSISSSDDESRGERPPPSMSSAPQTHHITRVKATATVKVEVHTPIPGNCIIHLYHNLLKFLLILFLIIKRCLLQKSSVIILSLFKVLWRV